MINTKTPKDSDSGGRSVFRRSTGEGGVVINKGGIGAKIRNFAASPQSRALVPLVVGFVLLLALVLLLGISSTRRLDAVSREVSDLQQRRSTQLRLLLNLRLALTELNNEARTRADADVRGGFLPPLGLRLRAARGRVEDQLPRFQDLPLIAPEAKGEFTRDLDEFSTVTESSERYNIEGFNRFRQLTEKLDRFRDEADAAQEAVATRTNELQQSARRSIQTTMLLTLIAGLAVAVGTIYEVQRRFRQVRESLDEAKRERAFSAQVLEGMPTAVATFDSARRLRSANLAFSQLFPSAIIGEFIGDDFAAPELSRMLTSVMADPAQQATYRGRWQIGKPIDEEGADAATDERMQTFDAYVAPLKISDADGMITTLVDVTEATAAERRLQRQASLAAVGQAAAQVAHEIKNPLGSIRLGVSLLREMTPDGEARDTINLIERGIEHLNKLTIDVTQYSRERPLELKNTDLHALLDASLELVSDKIEQKHLRVERRFTEEAAEGEMDADQLRQVFVNLIGNAADASAENDSITIITRIAAREAPGAGRINDTRRRIAHITVADTGSGIDERTLARLFEPFFTTKKRGTGLGLAVSKKLVEQHGGSIEVESTSNVGTRFHVNIPL